MGPKVMKDMTIIAVEGRLFSIMKESYIFFLESKAKPQHQIFS